MFSRTTTPAALRRGPLALAIAATFAVGACDSDSTGPDDHDHAEEVASIRLTVGSQTITIAENGAVTGGPVILTAGGATAISAEFLADDGDEVDVHDDDFRLDIEPSNTGVVAFARTGAFAGTLSGVAAGQTQVAVSLFHLEENHPDFGPFDVSVSVQ